MEVISEDSINRWIVPHLSMGKRGPKLQVKSWEIVSALLYKLKTGCQWRELFFGGRRNIYTITSGSGQMTAACERCG